MTEFQRVPGRKKGRVVLPLDRDPVFERLTLAELRVVRQVLVDEVERVAYWRRVLGVQAGAARVRRPPRTPVKEMSRALSDAGRSPQRMSQVPGGPAEPKTLPDLVALYACAMDPQSEAAGDGLASSLADADTSLADYGTELQDRVERVTTQIIVRYRESPDLALLLLPTVSDPWSSRPTVHHLHHDAGIRRGQRA
jgi:hypothetical protein